MSDYNKARQAVPPSDFYLDITLNRVEGHASGAILGVLDDATATLQNVNDLGGRYTYSTSAVTYFISSSSASDTDQIVILSMIDENNDLASRTVTVNGQTKTAIPGLNFRLLRATIVAGSEPLGDIYIYEDDTLTAGVPDTITLTRGKIQLGMNITRMAQITVPRNTSMILTDALYASGNDKVLTFSFRTRSSTGVGPWRTGISFSLFRSTIVHPIKAPLALGPGTDLEVLLNTDAGMGTGSVQISFINVDEDLFA